MIRHRSFRPTSSTVTSFVALFGNASDIFGPPVSASPNCWIDRAMTVHRVGLHLSTAPAPGTYTVQYFIGAVQTGTSAAISGSNTDQITDVDAAIPASGGATETFAHAWKITPSGTPAVSQSFNVTHVYEDDDDPAVNIFAWGNGSTNLTYPGSPTFIGFDGESFNATEQIRQAIMPAAGTFFRIRIRYITSAGTNYDIEVRKNGVTIDTTAIAGSATAVIVSDDINVPVVAGDLISFRINRTLGAGTTFIAYVQIYWRRE